MIFLLLKTLPFIHTLAEFVDKGTIFFLNTPLYIYVLLLKI